MRGCDALAAVPFADSSRLLLPFSRIRLSCPCVGMSARLRKAAINLTETAASRIKSLIATQTSQYVGKEETTLRGNSQVSRDPPALR